MKTIAFLLIVASLAVAQRPQLQKDRQILFDFRKERNTPAPAISKATERSVLSKVFRRYLTDANRCNPQFDARNASDPLAAARKAGEIVPAISAMATGSFTAAGQKQTLYVISVSECNASHADNFGTKRVAIFSGQQLVADLDVNFNQNIESQTDLNSDGINELLMTGGDMHQGIVEELATLYSFQNGRLQTVYDFGFVVEDSCAAVMPNSASKVSVLYISDVVPGSMPKFTMENYQAGCGKTRRWRLISRGKMRV
ncbi:MAG TPA: hypothetical protein VN644_06155 [Pyrinomonadaceae bacterium]|nr:hypothetical protein [Pyrinomonadaceae bacterium]